uniref:DOMON domain-containing protein n=1 Tax=Steinernema glaseri TaxID=37863 RepID=A0A1I7Z252_9BILA
MNNMDVSTGWMLIALADGKEDSVAGDVMNKQQDYRNNLVLTPSAADVLDIDVRRHDILRARCSIISRQLADKDAA